MSFTFQAERGTANEKTSDTSLSLSPTANVIVGRVLFAVCVTDNAATIADSNTHSVSDNAGGNTWQKLEEYTFTTGGAAEDGVTVSLHMCNVGRQIGTGNTITLTITSAITAKAIRLVEFSVAAGMIAVKAGSNQNNGSNGTPTVTLSGLASATHLFYGAVGREGPDGDTYTQDADYTDRTKFGTTGGSATGNVSAVHGHRTVSASSDTYDPTLGTNRDWADILVALDEIPATVISTPEPMAGGLFQRFKTFLNQRIPPLRQFRAEPFPYPNPMPSIAVVLPVETSVWGESVTQYQAKAEAIPFEAAPVVVPDYFTPGLGIPAPKIEIVTYGEN